MFDVIVIGGGHAGVEAAAAASRRGAAVALVTLWRGDLGQMSCNPSIGGVGKGHLVREIDALGGIMARAGDAAAIHRRMLNRSKGPAVRGPRVQADRLAFAQAVQSMLPETVDIVEGMVDALLIRRGAVAGVQLGDGSEIRSRAVVIATGTFLGATMFRGEERWAGGRLGSGAPSALAAQVTELGLAEGRLKTGTPPRLDGRTIDWARLTPQPSDQERWSLALEPAPRGLPQLACAITRTNPRTHELIRAAFDRSPLKSGEIRGRGPRYCPSIEDKVERFADRDSHQIFLEPEGLRSALVYPNGVSTSLPADVQLAMCRSIEGLERVEMPIPGYAVEYAYADPRRLDHRLGHQEIAGLFLAGQINGTTGYEEAGAQGLVAGANAAASALDVAPLTLAREDSYIGVMIDDLTLQGVTEPYRMLTARAEYRLHLRADNAISRLADTAIAADILTPSRRAAVDSYRDRRAEAARRFEDKTSAAELGLPGHEYRPIREWLSRPDAVPAVLSRYAVDTVVEEVAYDLIYAPYCDREAREIARRARDRQLSLDSAFDFRTVPGLSTEMRERLERTRPPTLDAASRVPGITPAALAALHFALVR